MRLFSNRRRVCFALLAFVLLAVPLLGGHAAQVIDILGRRVEVPEEVNRVLLGEGRFIVAIGALDRDDPTRRVVGMLGEYRRLDPDGYGRLARAFPRLEEIPLFGFTNKESVSVEQIITLEPDVAIFGVEGHGPSSKSKELLAILDAAGIPVVFVDFRDQPLLNTPRSMRILGEVLGKQKAAERFVRYYEQQLERVRSTLEKARPESPTVFMEIRVGLSEECCVSMGDAMLGKLLEAAGGDNMAEGLIPGAFGTVSLEYLLANQPDIYIGTAIGSSATAEQFPTRIVLGPGVGHDTARASLERAVSRPGLAELRAVEAGRAHGIWHHFYNSPLNVAALQAFAKWFHPELFHDLDPETTLRTLYREFQPLGLEGTYWISLQPES